MKRDFLKNLGIEDKELIDKILDENSADIGRAKGELDTYKTQVNDLKGQLSAKDAEINTLKEQADKVDGLNQQITQLTADKTQLTNDLNTKVSALQKSYAIESGLRDAKAKNIKAVMALLDMDKISYADGALTGLNEQLEALQKGEDTSFLFTTGDNHQTPSGTNVNNPPANVGNTPTTTNSLAGAIAKALSGNK